MSERLQKSVRKVLAQFGGGNLGFNPTAPGGLGFGKGPGAMGAGQINRYYETPLDNNFHRKFDPSYSDDKINLEKRLEIFHSDIENDKKGVALTDKQRTELDKSDKKLRFEKKVSELPEKDRTPEKVLEVCFEVLLSAARTNDDSEKHPFEDHNPPTIRPSRRHSLSQKQTLAIITDRMLGTSPFLGYEEDDDQRSPFDILKFTTPPDGSKRFHEYKDGKGVMDWINAPYDEDFNGLYGETLAFDHPQDKEQPYKTVDISTHEIAKEVENQESKNKKKPGGEKGLEDKRLEDLMRLPDGPGKTMRLDLFLGDTRDAFTETMGVADKYHGSAPGAVGLGNIGFSNA